MTFKIKHYLKQLDPEFKGIFKQKKDPYAFLASKIFRVPYEACSPFEFHNNKKIRTCKFPTAKGQHYRLYAKLMVMTAVYPKKTNLTDIINQCESLNVSR